MRIYRLGKNWIGESEQQQINLVWPNRYACVTLQLYLHNSLLTTPHVGLITIFACFTLPEVTSLSVAVPEDD